MLQLLTFTTLVQRFAAAAQAQAGQLLNFTVGSIELALAEAVASIGLWMQWLIVLVLAKTRAATSTAADLDTWMADFSLTRLPAVAASGTATFSRFTASSSALIPVGALAKTADGSQSFIVAADTGKTYWNAGMNGYLLPAGVISGDAAIEAVVAGGGGNVQIGAISLLASAIPGIDAVDNEAALSNGIDQESDADLRVRFANYINTRSRATVNAIGYAVQSVRQGLTWSVDENVLADGEPRMGNFVVTIDDGSGAPPSMLQDQVYAAIDAVRPLGSTFQVRAPTILTANVVLTITTDPTSAKPDLLSLVQTAIEDFINGREVGETLRYTRILSIAYGVDAQIANVSVYTLNAGTADLAGVAGQVNKSGTVTVN